MSVGRRYHMLALCSASYFLCYADRQLFSVLMPALRAEFSLSDTALGLLSGLAFGVFYTIFSIPLARITDRGSRKWMLTACIAVWSAATSLCSLAQSTFQLVLVRMGVAVGEAGGFPASISAIADVFPKDRRATAIAFYTMAGSVGGAVVLPVGAWIASQWDWRMAFLAVGAPGILLAVLAAFTFREPVRGASDGQTGTQDAPSLSATLRHVVRSPTYLLLCLGAAASAGVVSAIQWLPSFFERAHGLSLLQAGGATGLALLIASPIGQLVGGQMGDRLVRTSTRNVFLFMAGFAALAGVVGLAMIGAPSAIAAVVLMVAWKVAVTTFPPPAFALSQSLVEVRMRATSQALILIGINLFGYGGGPALTGWISESLGGDADALRTALLLSVGGLSALAATAYGLAAFASQRAAARA